MVSSGESAPGPEPVRAGAGVVGVGTDLVDIDRFRRVLARTPRVAERVFTDGERAYAGSARDPVPRLAARFAAKEAALKALGVGLGGARFAEIEVERRAGGEPALLVRGAAARRARERGVDRFLVTLSHTDHLAQATVIAVAGGDGAPPTPDGDRAP
ncbi:MAG: holo-ACP synthase [Actinomyces sp.]|nr:MAG: holo-ACP synthase [Actinomyces sp.]